MRTKAQLAALAFQTFGCGLLALFFCHIGLSQQTERHAHDAEVSKKRADYWREERIVAEFLSVAQATRRLEEGFRILLKKDTREELSAADKAVKGYMDFLIERPAYRPTGTYYVLYGVEGFQGDFELKVQIGEPRVVNESVSMQCSVHIHRTPTELAWYNEN